uniref:Uncharacterized protein n=1 Tax=Arundo donax TaxID=35708 RepID=A0A0A9B4T2_ARUDO
MKRCRNFRIAVAEYQVQSFSSEGTESTGPD